MSLAKDVLDDALQRVRAQEHTTWDDIGLLESLAAAAGLSQSDFYALLETLPSVRIQYGERMNPLERGYSRAAIGRNIEIEREHGRPAAQAAAIAYREARDTFRAEHPGKRLPASIRRKRNPPDKRLYHVKLKRGRKTETIKVHAQSDDAARKYVTGPLFRRRYPGAEPVSLRAAAVRGPSNRKRKKKSNPALSPSMQSALKLAGSRGTLRRAPGGYWVPNVADFIPASRGPRNWASTQTVRAMVARGVGEFTDWEQLRGERYPIEVTFGATKRNPSPRAADSRELAQARRAYRDFTGREPDRVNRYRLPDGTAGWALGPMPEIHYIATRDGETAHYVHKFRPGCRPLLGVSADGSQLYVLGGAYRVTNAGITDR